ncbi:MAG TPA: ATP synthase F1 subunit gamma [Candidatus Krumholzibacteria bacterium]|nr:ATP synthase F1 subunit gamma [Candidatus Krumholzibacteria bacterium]
MAKAKAILRRRRVVTNTRKITRTMELVSTAKFRQSFVRFEGSRPYYETMQEVVRELSRADLGVEHPLLEKREPARRATLLVLTSNRGLCGGFNTHLCRTARDYAAEIAAAGMTLDLHVAGKKGIGFFKFRGAAIAAGYTAFGDKPRYTDVETLAETLLAAYTSQRTDRVAVVYQRYVSAAVQRPQLDVLLPMTPPPAAPAASVAGGEVLFSPAAAELLQRLLPAVFKTTLYQLFLETAVGEQRARMVAMKNATDNAETMIKTLTRMYNRARQGQITNEISEIMGGVEALQ